MPMAGAVSERRDNTELILEGIMGRWNFSGCIPIISNIDLAWRFFSP